MSVAITGFQSHISFFSPFSASSADQDLQMFSSNSRLLADDNLHFERNTNLENVTRRNIEGVPKEFNTQIIPKTSLLLIEMYAAQST